MDEQTTALVKHTPSAPSTQPINLSDLTALESLQRQKLQFISKSALKLGMYIIAGRGAGKSRFMGRILVWEQLIHGEPAVVLDPTGGITDTLFDKILRLPPAYQAQLWPRLVYIDAGAKDALFPSPLYYRLTAQDTFFEMANRLVSVLKRQDENLEKAPILGFNAVRECAINAGMIAAASGKQLDFVVDLIEHPGYYKAQLRQVLADHPHLRPAVEYFRALMDPTATSLREKKTGSFKNKLLPFIADPVRMAKYAAQANQLDWPKLLKQNKVVLFDYRNVRDEEYRQFDLIWHFRGFVEAIQQRGMAGRGQECLLVIDEVTDLLGQRSQDGNAILTEDFQKLISRYSRAYGVNPVIAHQGLHQVSESIQELFMGMGNLLIGQLSSPNDALRVAKTFMRYDPYKLKKTENVWGTIHPPAILSYFGGPAYPYPQVIDERTIEFTPDEQLLAWVNKILDLDRFQFLTQIATGEGGKRGPIRKITIQNLDKNQYPNEAILAPLRQTLAKRDGVPIEQLLAEIQANRVEVTPEKKEKSPRQTPKEPATLKGTHDRQPVPTPSLSRSGESSADSGHPPSGASGSTDFWEPSPTNHSAPSTGSQSL